MESQPKPEKPEPGPAGAQQGPEEQGEVSEIIFRPSSQEKYFARFGLL